jgi:hypothetical protein
MTTLARLIASRFKHQCDWCGVALMTAFVALGLGFAHLTGHC